MDFHVVRSEQSPAITAALDYPFPVDARARQTLALFPWEGTNISDRSQGHGNIAAIPYDVDHQCIRNELFDERQMQNGFWRILGPALHSLSTCDVAHHNAEKVSAV